MRLPMLLLAAPLVLVLAAPAGAACTDEIDAVEQELAQLDEAAIEPAEGEQVEPVENWFGDSFAVEELHAKLEDARDLAQEGDEEGCLQMVGDVRNAMPEDAKQN